MFDICFFNKLIDSADKFCENIFSLRVQNISNVFMSYSFILIKGFFFLLLVFKMEIWYKRLKYLNYHRNINEKNLL